MRFDDFVLRVPGEADEAVRIRFHDRLTVLAGVNAVEREAIVEAIVGALTGEVDATTLRCTDHTGRPVEITTAGGVAAARYLDDASPAPAPVGWLAPDADALRDVVLVTAEDLGPSAAGRARPDDPPQLVEARRVLEEATAELEAAVARQALVEQAEAELAAIDEQVRAAEEDAARRAYARVLAELEHVRAEASALDSGARGAEVDRLLLASRDEVAARVAEWRALVDEADQAAAAAAGDEPIDPADLPRLLAVPASSPPGLAEVVAELVRATEHVTGLEERLRVVASASLPEPDDPHVLALAALDQADLWAARDAVVEARAAVGREQVAVGGIGASGEHAAAIAELELAHAAVEAAAAGVRRRRIPVAAVTLAVAAVALAVGGSSPVAAVLLCALAAAGAVVGLGGPLRARSQAAEREAAALERVGVPTYLSFHLRRVDATIDPAALERLSLATVQLAAAERAWTSIAGSVGVETASRLEPTVREYAAALATREGAVREVAELRRTLDELALPDLASARAALAEAVAPFGLAAGDLDTLEPHLVLEFVARQVALGAAARRRHAADVAAGEADRATGRLEALFSKLGFLQGDLAGRAVLVQDAIERAREREAARASARPRHEIDADLARLQAEVRRLRRPEWDDVCPADGEEPDLAPLLARRQELADALAREGDHRAEVAKAADHQAAAERRVTAIEVQLRGYRADSANVEELQRYLLAALTRANNVGPHRECVPVVLDDPFTRVPAERKWELMDMLRRLAEKTQVVYLTDDPFIGAWARRRADSGTIRLLEPVE